jgi:hypothetical protein
MRFQWSRAPARAIVTVTCGKGSLLAPALGGLPRSSGFEAPVNRKRGAASFWRRARADVTRLRREGAS